MSAKCNVDIRGCPLSQFLSLRDYESCFSEREMATVFLMPKMLKHDSYEKENSLCPLRSRLVFNPFNLKAGRGFGMALSKEIAIDKIVTYQKNRIFELFSIKINGLEVVALNREDSENVEELLHEALEEDVQPNKGSDSSEQSEHD